MAIAVHGTPTSATDSGNASITINVPTGVSNGDLLVFIGSIDNPGTMTKPAAFTAGPVNGTNFNFGGLNFKNGNFWYRIASSEPASYTITKSTNDAACVMVAYSGVDNATPMDVNNVTFVGTTNVASPDTENVTGITTATNNAWVLVGLVLDRGPTAGAGASVSTTSGMTIEISTVAGNSTSIADAALMDVAQASAGASGTKAFTFTWAGHNSNSIFAYTIALRPASGAATIVDDDYYKQGGPWPTDNVVTVYT